MITHTNSLPLGNPLANAAQCMECGVTIAHDCYVIVESETADDLGKNICLGCAVEKTAPPHVCMVAPNHSLMMAFWEFRMLHRHAP